MYKEERQTAIASLARRTAMRCRALQDSVATRIKGGSKASLGFLAYARDFSLFARLLGWEGDRRRHFEADCGLCRNSKFFVAGEGCACGTGACAYEPTDESTLTSTSKSADQGARARTSSDYDCRALPFAFLCNHVFIRAHIMWHTFDVDGSQPNGKDGFPFELAR